MTFQSIQAGRGLAAIMVAAFHLSLMVSDKKYFGHYLFEHWTGRGHLGVEFFFVLSGFIIFYVHEKDIGQPQRWRGYLLKRASRLHPPVWIYTTIVCIALALGLPAYMNMPQDAWQWISSYSLIRLELFIPPIRPTWTLFHEVAFNLLFSLLILNRRLGVAGLTLWTVGSLLNFQYAPEDKITPFNTYFSAQNIEFILGIGAYYLWKRGGDALCRVALIAGVIVVAANGIYDFLFPEYTLLLAVYALGFALMLAGFASWERSGGVLFIPGANLFGNASYSIYLTHLLTMEIALLLAARWGLTTVIGEAGVYALTLAVGLGMGILAYRVVEKPIADKLKPLARARPATT